MIKYGVRLTNDEKLRMEQLEEFKLKRDKFMEKIAATHKKLKDEEDDKCKK